MAVALMALFVALAGSATAAVLVTSTNIKNGTIRGIDVRNGGLSGLDVRNGSVTGADVNEASLAQVPSAANAVNAGTLDGLDGLDAEALEITCASAIGGGPNPSSTVQFFGAQASVTVTRPQQRVLVVASSAFGTSGLSANALNLFICYQQPPGPLTPVGNGILGLQLPPNTASTMGLNKIIELPVSPDPYVVGMCGTGGANWTNNGWGTTSALVFSQ